MATPQVLHRIPQGDFQPPEYVFTFPKGRGTITGIDQLSQTVLMHLLTTPGSDRYLTDEGGGLFQAFVTLQQTNNFAQVATDLSEAVARTKAQIIASQTAEEGLTERERLSDLRIDHIERVGQRVALRVIIVSEATETATFDL